MAAEQSSPKTTSHQGPPVRSWLFAVLATVSCLIPVILFTASQVSIESSIWPFPGIYFLEIILLGLLALISLTKNSPAGELSWTSLPWIGAGGLLAFVILGAWTIGFFLIPGMALSILVGVTEDRRKMDNLGLHVILFLAAAFVQAVIVWLVISINVS